MLPAILGGIGLVQGITDAKDAKKQKQAEAARDAEMIRWSPWSGISGDKFAGNSYLSPSETSGGLAGAASFAQTGMNMENAFEDSKKRKQLADYYLNRSPAKATPYSGIMKDDAEKDYLGLLRDKAQGMGGFDL
jgi:hypothetical protein